jgi:hypothetical protein
MHYWHPIEIWKGPLRNQASLIPDSQPLAGNRTRLFPQDARDACGISPFLHLQRKFNLSSEDKHLFSSFNGLTSLRSLLVCFAAYYMRYLRQTLILPGCNIGTDC